MLRRLKFAPSGGRVIPAVCLSVVAVAAAGPAMWLQTNSIAIAWLALVIVALGVGVVLQIRGAIRCAETKSHLAHKAINDAERHYVCTLGQIVKFVETRDKFCCGHSENVGKLTEQIARGMGLSTQKCSMLKLAGELHDIGMIAIPGKIMEKYRSFTVDEFRIVKQHPEVSYQVLKPLNLLADVLPAIRHHHERMNGTGYPDGLAGDDIPLDARILAVADTYDAMTHDRPQRSALSPVQAMGELLRCTPAGYDPQCVEALAKVVNLPTLETFQLSAVG